MSESSDLSTGVPHDIIARRSKPWLTLMLLAAFGLTLALWLGGASLKRRWRSHVAANRVKTATELMEEQRWSEAARFLEDASSKAPDDPVVMRAVAQFQIRVQPSMDDAVVTLKRLTAQGGASKDDILTLARAELQRGNLQAVSDALDSLPPIDRSSPEASALDAMMLKQAGQHEKAEMVMRSALSADLSGAEAQFKMALLDYLQPYQAMHLRGRDQMWILARAGHENVSNQALTLLADDPHLTSGEADELERLTHASHGPARLAALRVRLKSSPVERERMLDRETASAASADVPERFRFAAWLAEVGEHERLLRFIPDETTAQSAEESSAWLKLRFAALAKTRRWDALSKALTPAAEKALGGVASNLWRACLAVEQAGAVGLARQHLELALKSAKSRVGDFEEVMNGAALSEQHEFWALAAEFYQQAASVAVVPRARLAMLEKALTMHSRLGETSAMQRLAAEIARLTPGNEGNAFRADYLALLSGEFVEVTAEKIAQDHEEPGSESSARRLLLRALAAYRLHQPPSPHLALRELKSSAWPPGHRAVLAALIAHSGDQAAAYQIAERIPDALLLPEEARLLALAR